MDSFFGDLFDDEAHLKNCPECSAYFDMLEEEHRWDETLWFIDSLPDTTDRRNWI